MSSILRCLPGILRAIPDSLPHQSNRQLFRWLNPIFNNVDDNKIRELGPEVAAAEWLIRNGAQVKWSSSGNGQFTSDYDSLIDSSKSSEGQNKSRSIIEIDATNASITHHGFEYLKNLKNIQKIKFVKNDYLEDGALRLLSSYELPSLKHLELKSCYEVTDKGVLSLTNLKSLESMKLEDLPSVKNASECKIKLQQDLPSCEIEWSK